MELLSIIVNSFIISGLTIAAGLFLYVVVGSVVKDVISTVKGL